MKKLYALAKNYNRMRAEAPLVDKNAQWNWPQTSAGYGALLAKHMFPTNLDSARRLFHGAALADRNWNAFLEALYGPSALHFVGFKGDEYTRAVRLFGKPDFIHRYNDARFRHGGELAPHDMVVYANGSEADPRPAAFDDSSFAGGEGQHIDKAAEKTQEDYNE